MLDDPSFSIDRGTCSNHRARCSGRLSNRRKAWRLLHVVVSAVMSLACMLGVSAANAKDYVLGPQDKLRVKVYEWRASRDTIFGWDAINDEYTVGPNGSVSLPLVGEIKAAGLTTGEIANSIGYRLMKSVGLMRKPDTAVEIVQYRPFYVVGKVTQSGEFAYRPGLTVLQALSIAGGLRTREDRDARFEREVILGRGDVTLLRLNEANLLARKARLEAELSHASDIQFPAQLTSRIQDDVFSMLMNQERLIFQARSKGLDTQIKALHGLREFLQKELASLEAQLVFLDKQIDSIQKELTAVSALVVKGLAAAPREFSLERALAQAQSERLSAETSLLRGRQEISKTEISILQLEDGRKNEITIDLRQTQAELDALDSKTETARRLLYDSAISAPNLLARRADADLAAPIYTIFRPSADGTTAQIQANETSVVEPGDTIKIEIPLAPDETGALDLTSTERHEAPGIELKAETAGDTVGIP
ncbi:MAG: sugar ABC transporter substrate-binding protein [Mesorhizobium sp.]|nr:MAG: sugar ABC transporter substrate-binding protein [Mesorhizobium sp.]RWM49329.1 MAG: sugar ABC transporter substrate-binding protein [Mesorhizobium sp.]RWM54178.1 MAG: sugar ABC transporter substrate-binding protein [Mesorhizobium sp.]RWM57742.1 MAG: sugar ABC transporter substrate-binding protein [Mesorhizobium sp.]RWM83668.1 MAG: sugar ABC transporter substrate-binding protein [Mesorhizobium sp.]